MSFDPFRHRPRLRRTAPWLVWAGVLVLVLVALPRGGTVGVVPGSVLVKQAAVVSPRSARVVRVQVQAGAVVRAGDVLVELDTSGADLDLAIANAELERARVSAVAVEFDVRGADLEGAARLAQEAERASVDLAALVSNEKRDRLELQELDELMAKQQKLVEQGLASAATRDELRLRRATLAERTTEYASLLAAARDHETSARERLRAWRATREKAAGAAPPLEARVAPARAAIAAQEERVKQLQHLKDALTLRAPFAGRIGEVLTGEGDTAIEGAHVVTVIDDRPTQVLAWLDERAAGRVQIGEKVTLLASDHASRPRPGRVAALSPAIAETPVRFRPVPQQPQFARAVYIDLLPTDVPPPLPGQAFDCTFEGTLIAAPANAAAAAGAQP